jgi:hypothetical protein
MFKKITAAAALALAASSVFAAAPTAFYGGVDAGSTKIDDSSTEASFGGFLGYGFNRFVAVELGYRQLGKFDLPQGDVKVKQSHVSVVGFFPLSPQIDVYGRVGYNKLTTNVNSSMYTVDDVSGSVYGVGLNYSFTPAISGRVEVQKPASDITHYNIGVAFQF